MCGLSKEVPIWTFGVNLHAELSFVALTYTCNVTVVQEIAFGVCLLKHCALVEISLTKACFRGRLHFGEWGFLRSCMTQLFKYWTFGIRHSSLRRKQHWDISLVWWFSTVVPICKEFSFSSSWKAISRSHPFASMPFVVIYCTLGVSARCACISWQLHWKMKVWGAFIEVQWFCRNLTDQTPRAFAFWRMGFS